VLRSNDTREAVKSIVDLRRAEREADPGLRDRIGSVRAFLEQLVGPTVRPADAARLLGIRQPSLQRWIDKGEIASVLTPGGRREIPLSELVELLDEVDERRADGGSRPVAAVINERRQRSAESIDINRLLPSRRRRSHRVAELQALAYHRLVAERLDERILDDTRNRLRRWRDEGRIDERWADEWSRILTMPVSRIARTIGADTPRARELRQTSPFAGVLTAQERQALVRAVEERART
jgi:excisionase family DNA binding protein